MRRSQLLRLVCLILILCCNFCFTLEAQQRSSIDKFLFHQGDNGVWKSVSYDDSNWLKIHQGLPDETGVYWARLHVEVVASGDTESQALFTSILGAYDIYWDGFLLSSNGIVGDSVLTEVPGKIDKITQIPSYLWTEGSHVISIRISNFHSPDQLRSHYFVARLGSGPLSNSFFPLTMFGGFVILALYFLQLYALFSPQKVYLVFSLLCFSLASLLVAETWRNLLGYDYDWHQFRLISVGLLTFVVATLLPLYFLFQLSNKNKIKWMAPLILILLSIAFLAPTFDMKNLFMLLASFIFSLSIAFSAARLNKDGSKVPCLAIISMIAALLCLPSNFMEMYFFPMFAIFIFTELAFFIRKMKVIDSEKNIALLNSANLEISLLRKNIQPHFILNTLTSIEQWIEDSPKTAILFIDALADEFRVLSNISHQKLIYLHQEIELCRSHLEIMSYRQNQQYTLQTENIDPMLPIPPAILHTLIENSLTHNRYTADITIFTLRQCHNLQDDSVELQLSVPISRYGHQATEGTGTGLKYIRARLTESFQQQWQFEEQADGNFWVTKITIPKSENMDEIK